MINNIPPTSAALTKHVTRATYIAGHLWAQCLLAIQDLRPPDITGSKYDKEKLIPDWTSLQEASDASARLKINVQGSEHVPMHT